MSAAPLLDVRGLCKHFPVRSRGLIPRITGVVKAADDVSFTLARGKTLGLVGESGCGKTTTARAILRAIDPTSGSVLFRDGDAAPVDLARLTPAALKPLRRRMQMVFQDPISSLNPRLTVGGIVAEPLVIHGLGDRSERDERVAAMLTRVGLSPDIRDRYPHEFSGGQRQRIGIARALVMKPSLVVADEAVSALDVSVQAQVINLLAELRDELGLTMIFVAHDLAVVRHLCDEVAVMYAGRIVEHAPTAALFSAPKHPYTRALLAAVPEPDPDRPLSAALAGEVADPSRLPGGCAFHPRCAQCFAPCAGTRPELRQIGNRRVACHLE